MKFLVGAVFAILGLALGGGNGFVIGLAFGSLNGWIVELEMKEPGVQYGGSLGAINGLLIGAIFSMYAGGNTLHWLFGLAGFAGVGVFLGGTVIPGLLSFWDGIDPSRS